MIYKDSTKKAVAPSKKVVHKSQATPNLKESLNHNRTRQNFIDNNINLVQKMIAPTVKKNYSNIPQLWRIIASRYFFFFILAQLVLASIFILVDIIALANSNSSFIWSTIFGLIIVFSAYLEFLIREFYKKRISLYFVNSLDLKDFNARLFNNFAQLQYLGATPSHFEELNKLVRAGKDFTIPKNAKINSRTKTQHLAYKGNRITYQVQGYKWRAGDEHVSNKHVGLINIKISNSRFSDANNAFALAFRAKNPPFSKLPLLTTEEAYFNRFYQPRSNQKKLVTRILTPRVIKRLVNLAKHGLKTKNFTFEKNRDAINIKFTLMPLFFNYVPYFKVKNKYDYLGLQVSSMILQQTFEIYQIIRLAIDSTLI